ncbi:MgtC/SapB family protein [Bordetella genomosp. 13]|uniref:MgtC/SapB family protein n=1 Tax=Bordetella genomosp. 13 TaxID=463040 RepID=UPI0011A441A1|nr:MgtC/SapB family protein [Bordetella genomosp. 13]
MHDIWFEIWTTLRAEFSDVPDASEATRMVVRLMMAALLGGLLGYERERSGKSAGLRTHILVALGAALFVLAPQQAGMHINDLSRVMQGVIAGIGFLGAGAIIKFSDERRIRGLTTSAGIWLTAAIGITAGMGRETTAVFTTLLALFVLHVLHIFEKHMEARRQQGSLLRTDSTRTDLPARRSVVDEEA